MQLVQLGEWLSQLMLALLLLLELGAYLGQLLVLVLLILRCQLLLGLVDLLFLLCQPVKVLHLLQVLQGLLKLAGLLLWIEATGVELCAVERSLRGLHEVLPLVL